MHATVRIATYCPESQSTSVSYASLRRTTDAKTAAWLTSRRSHRSICDVFDVTGRHVVRYWHGLAEPNPACQYNV